MAVVVAWWWRCAITAPAALQRYSCSGVTAAAAAEAHLQPPLHQLLRVEPPHRSTAPIPACPSRNTRAHIPRHPRQRSLLRIGCCACMGGGGDERRAARRWEADRSRRGRQGRRPQLAAERRAMAAVQAMLARFRCREVRQGQWAGCTGGWRGRTQDIPPPHLPLCQSAGHN